MKAGEHTVVITGTSSGIGRATAAYLDKKGIAVIGTVRRKADAEMLSKEMSSRFTPVILDVTDEHSIAHAVSEVAERIGDTGLDGLVNNAGLIVSLPLELVDIDTFRSQLEVNVTGQLAVTQAFLPLIRKAQGRIVNMGSISGKSVLPVIGPYCASKFALEAITDALRMELRPWGIHVSIIEPGSVSTPIMEKADSTASGVENGQGRPAAVEEVAGDDVRQRYDKVIEGMSAGFTRSAESGSPPEAVAAVVYHALTAKQPKTRYLVGRVAYLRNMARVLPDRLRDKLIALVLRSIT